jgi:hypothetical protein
VDYIQLFSNDLKFSFSHQNFKREFKNMNVSINFNLPYFCTKHFKLLVYLFQSMLKTRQSKVKAFQLLTDFIDYGEEKSLFRLWPSFAHNAKVSAIKILLKLISDVEYWIIFNHPHMQIITSIKLAQRHFNSFTFRFTILILTQINESEYYSYHWITHYSGPADVSKVRFPVGHRCSP